MSADNLPTNTTPFFMKGELLFSFSAYGLANHIVCLLYTSPSPRDATLSRMPSSA